MTVMAVMTFTLTAECALTGDNTGCDRNSVASLDEIHGPLETLQLILHPTPRFNRGCVTFICSCTGHPEGSADRQHRGALAMSGCAQRRWWAQRQGSRVRTHHHPGGGGGGTGAGPCRAFLAGGGCFDPPLLPRDLRRRLLCLLHHPWWKAPRGWCQSAAVESNESTRAEDSAFSLITRPLVHTTSRPLSCILGIPSLTASPRSAPRSA